MKYPKIIIIVILLFASFAATAQTVYTFAGYKLCGVDAAGNVGECKDYKGTSMFEYFKINYNASIEYKFVNQAQVTTAKWDKDALGSVEDGTVIYKLLDKGTPAAADGAAAKNQLIVFLVFDAENHNKLLKVVYVKTENGMSNMATLNVKN